MFNAYYFIFITMTSINFSSIIYLTYRIQWLGTVGTPDIYSSTAKRLATF